MNKDVHFNVKPSHCDVHIPTLHLIPFFWGGGCLLHLHHYLHHCCLSWSSMSFSTFLFYLFNLWVSFHLIQKIEAMELERLGFLFENYMLNITPNISEYGPLPSRLQIEIFFFYCFFWFCELCPLLALVFPSPSFCTFIFVFIREFFSRLQWLIISPNTYLPTLLFFVGFFFCVFFFCNCHLQLR